MYKIISFGVLKYYYGIWVLIIYIARVKIMLEVCLVFVLIGYVLFLLFIIWIELDKYSILILNFGIS